MLIANCRRSTRRKEKGTRLLRRAAFLTATALLLLLAMRVILARAPGGPVGEPWVRWPDAAAAGYSEAGLETVRAYAETLGTTGLMVIRGGKVLLEYGDVEAIGFMAEGRTSVMAMVYGKPVVEGTVDLGLTLDEMGIDDRPGLLPVERIATIEDLLTSRSGVYHPTEFIDPTQGIPPRGSVEPGSSFFFHSWGSLAAREIFTMLTGRDLFQAIGEDLADKLGLQDFDWRRCNPGRDRSRSVFTLFHLYVSTRDVARFGQLMLQKGLWKEEQLIPGEWVDRMTTVVTPASEIHPDRYRGRGLGYGLAWWVWDEPDPEGPYVGAYTYMGDWGQFLTVLPKLELVVAHQVFAGWYGAPARSVRWEEYQGILDRLVAARLDE